MTTLQQYAIVRLAVEYDLHPDQAVKVVSAEVEEWRKASIPFPWDADISKGQRFMDRAYYFAKCQYEKQIRGKS